MQGCLPGDGVVAVKCPVVGVSVAQLGDILAAETQGYRRVCIGDGVEHLGGVEQVCVGQFEWCEGMGGVAR